MDQRFKLIVDTLNRTQAVAVGPFIVGHIWRGDTGRWRSKPAGVAKVQTHPSKEAAIECVITHALTALDAAGLAFKEPQQ